MKKITGCVRKASSTSRNFPSQPAPTVPEPERRHPHPRSLPHRPRAGPLPAPADLPTRFSFADTTMAGPKTLSFSADTTVTGPQRSRLAETQAWRDRSAPIWCGHSRGRTQNGPLPGNDVRLSLADHLPTLPWALRSLHPVSPVAFARTASFSPAFPDARRLPMTACGTRGTNASPKPEAKRGEPPQR